MSRSKSNKSATATPTKPVEQPNGVEVENESTDQTVAENEAETTVEETAPLIDDSDKDESGEEEEDLDVSETQPEESQPQVEQEGVEQSPPATEPEDVPTPKEKEIPAQQPTAPEPISPKARNAKNKKGLVRSNLNAAARTETPVLTLASLVKHKHDFDIEKASGPLLEVICFLDSYQERMSPNINVDALVGESLQKQLFKNYLKILGLPPLERGVALEVLLWKFFENVNQVWRVNNLSRYTRNGRWNIEELQMFVQLSNLFNHVKDPAERIARIRTIQLGGTVVKFPGEKARYTESLIAWATSLK